MPRSGDYCPVFPVHRGTDEIEHLRRPDSKPRGLLDVLRGLDVIATSSATLSIYGLARRNVAMVHELVRFSFPDIAAMAGGLLTYPENQPATFRLEALVALAAIHARGVDVPGPIEFARWLNGSLLTDPLGQLEGPVEDVFMSNVSSWNGNIRLFDGLWSHNDQGTASLVWACNRLKDGAGWAAEALDSCLALLDLSEAIASRTGTRRYAMSGGNPRSPINVSADRLAEARSRVTFGLGELLKMEMPARRIRDFGLTPENRQELAEQSIGNLVTERRPLIRHGTDLIVALPTALGAAIRRLVLERASGAGALADVTRVIADLRFAELREFTLTDLRAEQAAPTEELGDGNGSLVTTFDEGAYLHLVHVVDDLADVLAHGLRSLHAIPDAISAHVAKVAASLRDRPGFQRGLTVIVHSGVGRGCAADLGPLPTGWLCVAVERGDLDLIGRDHGFDALRLWKILDQEAHLEGRGYRIRNINGFPNLYGWLSAERMAIVPDCAPPGSTLDLATNHVAALRGRLRPVVDSHVAVNAAGDRWAEVQRSAAEVFFGEVEALPLFLDRLALAHGVLSACVETDARPWWVTCPAQHPEPAVRDIHRQIWDMVQNWMVRAAPALETLLPGLPDGPMGIVIEAPDTEAFDARAAAGAPFRAPGFAVDGQTVTVRCDPAYLASFTREENVGERMMVAAIARGFAIVAGTSITEMDADDFAAGVIGSTSARFFHILVPKTPSMLVYSAAGLPAPRFVQHEDIAWRRLRLAEAASWSGGPGPIPLATAPGLLKTATVAILSDMKELIGQLDREALVKRVLVNHDAVAWDRQTWGQTAAALLALYQDHSDVIAASNELERRRGIAGLAARVLAEMAVCIAPATGGRTPTTVDVDRLLADLAVMIACANEDDAIHWQLTDVSPTVNANGSLSFDTRFREEEQAPYVSSLGERAFRDAAASNSLNFRSSSTAPELKSDPAFLAAITDEYGIDLQGLANFAMDASMDAAAAGTSVLRLRRSEAMELLINAQDDVAAVDAEKTLDMLTLKPRTNWDDQAPSGASKRDWYPWRFSRRLSVLRRPLVQVGEGDDPVMLIVPSLLDLLVQSFFQAERGLLPIELFTGEAMRSWIGKAVHAAGHAFNGTVADRLAEIGWDTRTDVKLTELGGTKRLGDVDVLAWHRPSGTVIAIECKRLQMARSVGEIGERLAEYTTIAPRGAKRTPIQKHLDRLTFLHANPARLAKVTGIPVQRVALRSALVTDNVVPMLFSKKAATMVNVIGELRTLAESFPLPPSD